MKIIFQTKHLFYLPCLLLSSSFLPIFYSLLPSWILLRVSHHFLLIGLLLYSERVYSKLLNFQGSWSHDIARKTCLCKIGSLIFCGFHGRINSRRAKYSDGARIPSWEQGSYYLRLQIYSQFLLARFPCQFFLCVHSILRHWVHYANWLFLLPFLCSNNLLHLSDPTANFHSYCLRYLCKCLLDGFLWLL